MLVGEAKQEDDRKRKADLWSSFLKDVKGPKPKVAKLSSDSITEQEKNESISGGKIQERSSDSTILTESVSDCREKKDPKPNPTADKKSSPSKTTDSSEWIEVKRVYDFAGEEIVVTEKVAATSKQASPPITEVENAEKSQSSDEKSASSTKDSADRLAPIKDQESVSASPLITNSATGTIYLKYYVNQKTERLKSFALRNCNICKQGSENCPVNLSNQRSHYLKIFNKR